MKPDLLTALQCNIELKIMFSKWILSECKSPSLDLCLDLLAVGNLHQNNFVCVKMSHQF